MPRQGVKDEQGTRNAEIVRATYDALNRRDIDGLFAMFHQDFEFHDHGTGFTQRAPEYRRWLDEYFESWEHYQETPEQLTPLDDRVLACVRSKGKGKRSRADMEDQHGEIHTLQDGLIFRIALYPTYALARTDFGLEAGDDAATDRRAARRGGRFRRWRR